MCATVIATCPLKRNACRVIPDRPIKKAHPCKLSAILYSRYIVEVLIVIRIPFLYFQSVSLVS